MLRGRERLTHPMYRRWTGIRQACKNPHSPDYKYAGAIGISCDNIDDFEDFVDMVETAIGVLPDSKMKLHRKDQTQGWTANNIMWATSKQVSNNLRCCVKITYQNRTQTALQWSQELGLDYSKVLRRFHNGQSVEQVLMIKEDQ